MLLVVGFGGSMAQAHPTIVGRVIGGGRIQFVPKDKKCAVWGYSKTFGRTPGCNEKSADIIRKCNPGFDVTWSDDGY